MTQPMTSLSAYNKSDASDLSYFSDNSDCGQSTQQCCPASSSNLSTPNECYIEDLLIYEIDATKTTEYELEKDPNGDPYFKAVPAQVNSRSISFAGTGGMKEGRYFEVVAGNASAQAKTKIRAIIVPLTTCEKQHVETKVTRPGEDTITEICRKQTPVEFPVYRVTHKDSFPGVGLLEKYWSFAYGPQKYTVSAISCGIINSGQAIASAEIDIYAYPFDQFTLLLKVPPLTKKSYTLERDRSWRSSTRKEESTHFDGSKESETTTTTERPGGFVSDRKVTKTSKGKTTEEEETTILDDGLEITFVPDKIDKAAEPDKLTLEFQINGVSSDALKRVGELYKVLKEAQDKIKAIKKLLQDWVPQVGFKFEFDLSFFSGSVGITWGYREYIDHRVYFGVAASVELVIFQITLTLSFGIKVGPATARVEGTIKEGSVKVSGQFSVDSPDRRFDPTIVGKGEIPVVLQGVAEVDLVFAKFRAAAGVKSGFTIEGGSRRGKKDVLEFYIEAVWNGIDAFVSTSEPGVGEEEDVTHLVEKVEFWKDPPRTIPI